MQLWLLIILSQLVAILPTIAQPPPIFELETSHLEKYLNEIDAELNQLAHTSLRSGIGAIGYRSARYTTPDHKEWIEIKLDKDYSVDEIILVPNIYRDSSDRFHSDGFPTEFRIITGNSTSKSSNILGEFSSTTDIPQSIAPYVIATGGIKVSWIRIEATRLSLRAFDKHFNKHYIFQLAEVLAFSGEKNVALHQSVKASSEHPESNTIAWSPDYLLDGHTPYTMSAAKGNQSVAYISKSQQFPVLTIDLEAVVPIDRIHLHRLEQNDTVPQAYAGDLGIPKHLKIEGANQPDFSDAVVMLDVMTTDINNTGPIMMWNIPETTCRYIRLREMDSTDAFQIGFAEIELFSKDHNVARGKRISGSDKASMHRKLEALTDGHNLYGEILSIRSWLNQLARRHDLEVERLAVIKEITLRNDFQKTRLLWISWVAAGLLLGTMILLWFQYMTRQRVIIRTRERIAANLHDELGANLYAIGLLGDYAKNIIRRKSVSNEWAELNEVIDEVRKLTEETGQTARYCTNILETKEIHSNLVEEMKQVTSRILADLDYKISFPKESNLVQLKPRRRIDLYLFYKECLTNIIRHSGATTVSASLTTARNEIRLIVCDNGHGLQNIQIPESLQRRAKMLGGNVHTKISDTGGTQIKLNIRVTRGPLFKRK